MVTLQTPAYLLTGLIAGPSVCDVGRVIRVQLSLTNAGQATAGGVSVSPLELGGTGQASQFNSGGSVGGTLSGGATGIRWWTLTATGVGDVCFSTTVSGYDANVGASGTTSAVVPGLLCVTVLPPGSLRLELTSVTAVPNGVFVGDTITLSVTARNAGTAVLTGVVPAVPVVLGEGQAEFESGPSPVGATLGPGESTGFTFAYKAMGPGSVRFRVGASGVDGSVVAAVVEGNAVVIRGSPAGIVVWPSPFRRSTAVRGTLKFCCLTPGDRVTVYTVRGLEVWHADAVVRQVEWDGKNSAGNLVVPGTYQWIIEGSGNRRRGTVVVE